MPERRRKARAEAKFELQYRTVQEFVAAYSRNISGGGIYVLTRKPLDLTQKALLQFTLPGTNHHFQVEGAVVWINFPSKRNPVPAGMGIKFLNLDPKARRQITDFIRRARVLSTPPRQKPLRALARQRPRARTR